jgi:hypothetical protein
MSDPQPLGSGPPNRHGMPKLPIEQVATEKWPVLDPLQRLAELSRLPPSVRSHRGSVSRSERLRPG